MLSAPSGAGKTTLREKLRELMPDLEYSVSVTTRCPRAQEIEGKDYHFVLREAFESARKNHGFIEWAEVHGNLYGTPVEFIEKNLKEGKDVLLDIDVKGALQIKKQFPSALLIFIDAVSTDVLRERLLCRGTNTLEEVEERIQKVSEERSYSGHYDHVIVNENLKDALAELERVVTNYRKSARLR